MPDLCSKLCMGIYKIPCSSSICVERLKMKKIFNVNVLMKEICKWLKTKKQHLYIWKLVISPKEMITIYL